MINKKKIVERNSLCCRKKNVQPICYDKVVMGLEFITWMNFGSLLPTENLNQMTNVSFYSFHSTSGALKKKCRTIVLYCIVFSPEKLSHFVFPRYNEPSSVCVCVGYCAPVVISLSLVCLVSSQGKQAFH